MNINEDTKKNYLLDHLERLRDSRSRLHKKQWISYNYKKFIPTDKNANILEIGPGFGELLEFLIIDCKYNNVKAIDISDAVENYCNKIIQNSTIKVNDTVEFLKNNKNKFDVIFMLQLLEHIPKKNVNQFLIAVNNALSDNGKVIIEVPNAANFIIGINNYFSDFTHEVAYTDVSLRYILQINNFSEIELFELKVPIVSIGRIIQAGLIKLSNLILIILNKIYLPSRKQILSPIIYAIAKK